MMNKMPESKCKMLILSGPEFEQMCLCIEAMLEKILEEIVWNSFSLKTMSELPLTVDLSLTAATWFSKGFKCI